jgi:hypothetical protein
MTAEKPSRREIAIESARLWLEHVPSQSPEAKALRKLGLLCCRRLKSGVGLREIGGSNALRLPRPALLVKMDRGEIMTLCRSISLASLHTRRREVKDRQALGEIFGGLALSYARVGDPSTAACLLRASAQLELNHEWLDEVERFLLDQQSPEGCFGLFTRELALVNDEGTRWMANLNFSVEVLWALAELMALRRGHEKKSGTKLSGLAVR